MRASAHILRWRPKSFDAAEQKPIRCICCGGSQMRSKKARLYMRTHDWSARDVLGLFISLIVTIGCLFLLVVISWKLRESDAAITQWRRSSLLPRTSGCVF